MNGGQKNGFLSLVYIESYKNIQKISKLHKSF